MKIIDNRKKELMFKDLIKGDVFIDTDNNVLMKTALYTVVSLDNGEVFDMPAEESVILLKKVKLVIED